MHTVVLPPNIPPSLLHNRPEVSSKKSSKCDFSFFSFLEILFVDGNVYWIEGAGQQLLEFCFTVVHGCGPGDGPGTHGCGPGDGPLGTHGFGPGDGPLGIHGCGFDGELHGTHGGRTVCGGVGSGTHGGGG